MGNYIREKWRHAGFQKYLRNIGWMFFARLVGLAISFFVTAYVARYLGPTNYGYLSYSVSFVGIFSFIATLGIDAVIYRDLIKFPEQKNAYLGSALFLKIAAGLTATVLVIVFGNFLSPHDISAMLVVILSFTFIFNSFSIINFEFQAKVESKYPSLISIWVAIILNLLKVLIVLYHKGIIYLAIVLLIEPIITALLLVYFRVKKIGVVSGWHVDRKITLSLLKDSSPLMLSSAFALVYGRIDQVFIKHLINIQSVGLYDAAVRLSELWYLIPNILVTSFFPAIVNSKSVSHFEYSRRLGRLAALLTILAVGVSLPFTLLAPFIMKLVFGTAFVAGAGVLQIYIWSNIGTFLSNLSSNYLINENMRFLILFSSLLGMVSNVVLNIVLIPRFGIEGSAYATLISYSLVPLCLFFFKKPRRQIIESIKAI